MKRCKFVLSGVRCAEEAVYTVVLADCLTCQREGGVLFCLGHSACIEHGAEVRADKYRTIYRDGDDQDVAVAQISATYRRAS